jgi:hypothetical protein
MPIFEELEISLTGFLATGGQQWTTLGFGPVDESGVSSVYEQLEDGD